MENRSDGVTNECALQSRLLTQTLASWRFFLFFTLPPMVWSLFIAQPGLFRVLIVVLSGVIWFGCWRLWLDARYFSAFDEEHNEQAGDALYFIWRRKKLQTLTFVERQQGALKQFKRTLFWVATQWLGWLILLLFA